MGEGKSDIETGRAGLKQCPATQLHLAQIMKNPQNPSLALLPGKKIAVKPAGNVCTPSAWTAKTRAKRTWYLEKLLRAWCRDQAINISIPVYIYMSIYTCLYIYMYIHIHLSIH